MSSSPRGLAGAPVAESRPARPFAGAFEHLLLEFDWLLLLLHSEVLRLRAAALLREDQFRGLYISDEEVDAILSQKAAHVGDAGASRQHPGLCELLQRSRRMRAEIDARVQETVARGGILPLLRLALTFGLSPFDCFAVLVCAAVEISSRFEILYAYVQNDISKKRATPDLIFKLFRAPLDESLSLRRAFSASAPLIRTPLVSFATESQDRNIPFLSRPLRLEPRILDYLLEHAALDERLLTFTKLVAPARPFSDLHIPQKLASELRHASRSAIGKGRVIVLEGPDGCGRRSLAEAISFEQQRDLLVADARRMRQDILPIATAAPLLVREAKLSGANLFLAHAEALFPEEAGRAQKQAALLDSFGSADFTFVIGAKGHVSAEDGLSSRALKFDVPAPDFEARTALWKGALDACGATVEVDVSAVLLANKFVLTGGEIHSICREAADRSSLRDPAVRAVRLADIESAVRSQSNHGLSQLAQKVDCPHLWDDLVLPARVTRQLREFCTAEKFRAVVYSRWGFGRRVAQGKGLNALFCGSSGTGKTMASGILARELGLELYKIDLSAVVSKYIGETEKQLNRIFHEARSSNCVLFFDEADALFGKRSEIKDAHDRYANVEVAYLLQKIEEYEGIVILATNFRKNIDDAFTRRMHFIIEFPFPDTESRERIWRGLIPAAAPLSSDVNFAFLARQFEFSGGNIRNIALSAAFLAAEGGGEIGMEHFLFATARELQKLGRVPARSEFREYFDVIRAAM